MIWIDVDRSGLLDGEQFGVDETASYQRLEEEIYSAVKAEYPEEVVMVTVVGIDDVLNGSDHLMAGDLAYIQHLANEVLSDTRWIVYE